MPTLFGLKGGGKIKNKLKDILHVTFIFMLVMLLANFILSLFDLVFLNWIKYTSIAACITGLFAGTYQYMKNRKIILIFTISAELVFTGIVALYCLFTFNQEKIVYKDGQKMIQESHSFLFSNWIKYYDYKNIFVRSTSEKIYEAYDDSLSEYLYTIYYNEDGSVTERNER